MIKKPSRRYNKQVGARRNPTGVGSAVQLERRTPIAIDDATFDAGPPIAATIVFDQPVTLTGIPAYRSQTSALPTSATLSDDRVTLTLHYAVLPTSVTVPFEDPAIRNGAGGYVSPGTFS